MALEQTEHNGPFLADPADHLVSPSNDFPHVGLCLFGYDTTRQRKSCGSLGSRNEQTHPTFCCTGIVRGDVVVDRTQIGACSVGPLDRTQAFFLRT